MRRPVGVNVLGVLMIAAGLGFAAAGFLFFFMGTTGASATAPTHGVVAAMLAAVGAAAGVIFLLFGALHVVLAIGIFRMRNVARVFTIFLFILIGAGASLGAIATLLSYSHIALAWNVSLLAVDALALWYLLRPETKAAFGA
jgi:hypothetical protein